MMPRLLLLVALATGLTAFSPVFAAEEAPPPRALGASLAAMRLFDLQGKRHALAEVRTSRVLVICWAFWCDTWKKALPEVLELHAKMPELDCTLWTMSIDGTYTQEIRPLVRRRAIPFPVLLDNGAWTRRLGLRRVPTLLLLDEERRVIWYCEGYPGNAKLEQVIQGVKEE